MLDLYAGAFFFILAALALGLAISTLVKNQFQTIQYQKGYLHHTGMTKEAYFLNFLSFKPDGNCWNMLSLPDASLARRQRSRVPQRGQGATFGVPNRLENARSSGCVICLAQWEQVLMIPI